MNKHTHIKNVHALTQTEKYHLSIQLGGRTPHGFYKYYFDDLPNHPTKVECFNHVNEIYFALYGEYRYEDYNSFRNQYNRHLKTQK